MVIVPCSVSVFHLENPARTAVVVGYLSCPVFLSLLPCSCSCPVHAPAPASALLLSWSCSFPYSCSAPAYLLLPYSCPAPTSTLVLPCPASALPGPALGPALLLPCSSSCPSQFGSHHHHHFFISTLQLSRLLWYIHTAYCILYTAFTAYSLESK